MKVVVLFSIPRTGTNYLHSVLRQWATLASFDELFHPMRVYGLRPGHVRALSLRAGIDFPVAAKKGEVGREFTQWARAHPLEAVDALERNVAGKARPAMMFKVFNGQWGPPAAEVIAGLARRPGFAPVVLGRRCIDAYVSLRKAQAHGKYKHVDTTRTPVELDAADYARWAAEARAWYRCVDEALARAGETPVRAHYERDIDLPPAALSAHWAGLLGLQPGGAVDAALAVERQDRAASLEAKISNYDAFAGALRERGLWDEALGDFAVTGAL